MPVGQRKWEPGAGGEGEQVFGVQGGPGEGRGSCETQAEPPEGVGLVSTEPHAWK